MPPRPIEWDFPRAASALVAAQRGEGVRGDVDDRGGGGGGGGDPSTAATIELDRWVVEPWGGRPLPSIDDCREDGGVYLLHPPVSIPLRTSTRLEGATGRAEATDPTEATAGESADEFDAALLEMGVAEEEDVDGPAARPIRDADVERAEWTFSVVFHPVYRVPTLYFACARPDGTSLGRREVLDALLRRGGESDDGGEEDEDEEERLWEFVSQEEHPATGRPSYFLHPCRTAERMEAMLPPSARGGEAQCAFGPLLSWLSMILPSVGCGVSAKTFRRMCGDAAGDSGWHVWNNSNSLFEG